MRIALAGDTIEALLTSTDAAHRAGTFKPTRLYDLACINLLRVGCPRELAAAADNKINQPLVIEKNRSKVGMIEATGYYPEAVVVAGGYRRAQLMAAGHTQALAWVERGSLEIQADDAIGCGELVAQLSAQLQGKCYGERRMLAGQPWPILCSVHPFASTVGYDLAGERYRQQYAIDPVKRIVTLIGESVKEINAACGCGIPQTGGRFTSNPLPLASNQVRMWGAPNSDIVRMVVRDSYSVQAVVDKLLDAIKNGLYKPMKPDFAPVNLSDDGKILGPLVEAGIAPADFIVWAAKYGQNLMCRQFSPAKRKQLAKSGAAMGDGSYPIVTRGDLDNAVRAFGRSPDNATKHHIIKRAKALGATDLLPNHWKGKVTIKSFGRRFRHGTGKQPHMGHVGNQKEGAFRV